MGQWMSWPYKPRSVRWACEADAIMVDRRHVGRFFEMLQYRTAPVQELQSFIDGTFPMVHGQY